MRPCLAILASSVLLLTAAQAGAVDYDKVERKLTKEPVYQTKHPKYALLLFGPQARLAVWVVLDGETLYVDLNGDGDLTAANERFAKEADFKALVIADPDGKTRYVIHRVQTDHSIYTAKARQEREKQGVLPSLVVDVNIKGAVEYQQYCDIVEMREDPKTAMLAHFHGPLKISPVTINWKLPDSTVLRKGKNPPEFAACIGTMSERHGCWVVVRTCADDKSQFPEGVRPVAEIEFPSANPGDKPTKKTYVLNDFRCSGAFRDRLVIPDAVGQGNAKVKLSFETWKDVQVLPSTTEIPIRPAEKENPDRK